MRSKRVLIAAALILVAGATPQPAASGPLEEVDNCADSIVNNRPTTVAISGYKFKCPGHIIVADENEIKSLPGYSQRNAYFKGALIRPHWPRDDKVRYFVIVENWADPQACRVLTGPMSINNGARRTVRAGRLEGSWEDVAQYLVSASAKRWADTFEFKGCRRGTAEGVNETSTIWLHPDPQYEGPLPFVGTWGPIAGARPIKLWLAPAWSHYQLHFLRAGRTNNDCWTPSATVILRDGGSLGPTEIAQILGATPQSGQKLIFVACYSSQDGQSPSSTFFNLDFAR